MRIIITLLAVLGSSSVLAEWQALPETAPAPANNPTTAEKVELGKVLYFDPRISSTGTVSCNSCHNVMAGGDDNRPTSMGVHGQQGGRSAPTVWKLKSASHWWRTVNPSPSGLKIPTPTRSKPVVQVNLRRLITPLNLVKWAVVTSLNLK